MRAGWRQVDKGKGEKGGGAANWKSEEEECAIAGTLCAFGADGTSNKAAYKRKQLFFSPLFEWGMDVCVVATARHH